MICYRILNSITIDNRNKLVFGHLNINAIRNKFQLLSQQVKQNIDVLTISETKVDDSFPIRNFLINSFSTPYRSDRDSKGGGIMLFVRKNIPSKLLAIESKPIESLYVELNLRKWLINRSYNPHKNTISTHIDKLSNSLDLFSANYVEMILLEDFNVEVNDNHMKSFCENYGLKILIKQRTCYKNRSNPTCIDLILTNVPRSFQITCVIETGLFDFHMMTLTVMRKGLKKFQPRIINHRSYRHFSNEAYRESLINKFC